MNWRDPRLAGAAVLGAVAAAVLVFLLWPRPAPPHPPVKPVAAVRHVAINPSLPRPAPPPKPAPVPHVPTVFELESRMSYAQLIKRWDPLIAKAAKRFGISVAWVRAVMQAESGGKTMLAENLPITSTQGAMGLMQLMPETYDEMRRAYRLGNDPYDPHDNIYAGAAYLRILRDKYGYPQMFAAYNDGPGNLEERMIKGGLLPQETRDYVSNITAKLEGRAAAGHGNLKLTRPDGTVVWIDGGTVTFVRGAFPGEYGPGVQTVVMTGRTSQAVREPLAMVRAAIRARGGGYMKALPGALPAGGRVLKP